MRGPQGRAYPALGWLASLVGNLRNRGKMMHRDALGCRENLAMHPCDATVQSLFGFLTVSRVENSDPSIEHVCTVL